MTNRGMREAMQWLCIIVAIALGAFTAARGAIAPAVAPGEDVEVIEAQSIRYGQYGSAVFHGSVIVDNDLTVTDDTTLTDDVDIDGDLDVDGTLNADAMDIDGNVQLDGTFTVGVAGTGLDVQFFSDTSGDHFLWDQSDEALTIIGTNGADALNIDDGNVDIADDVDVDGTTNLDDVDIDLSAEFEVDGHLTDFGGGTYTVADADNDVGVAGDLEVEGDVVLASANYPLEHGSSGREVYFAATSAFTGTTTVLSTTTGIANVTVVLCAIDDPDDDANDSFICIGSATDGDITITALATTGDSATEADTVAYYAVFGY